MKYLGIDYGAKRTGVALSDDSGRMAFPHSVVPTDRGLSEEIRSLAEREGAGIIVIGESLDRTGKDNAIMKEIRAFAAGLSRSGLAVEFDPEHYTSRMAARVQGENAMHDASAAALILQHYLDRKNVRPAERDPYALPEEEES